jgi:hypothetical protein
MKVVKELPKSLIYSAYLYSAPSKLLLSKKKEVLPIIVSLTSIPSRLNTIDLVIKSIFNQTHLPLKIVLWLHKDLNGKIPQRLKKLPASIFEIRFSDLDCPHLKLLESLKAFPNNLIITCDDDLIYRKNWLINLYQEHLKYPNDIITNGAYQIKFDDNGLFSPYTEWRKKDKTLNFKTTFAIGVLGVLYPPHCFSELVFDKDLFLKLTPKNDDLWFKAMALINKTNTRQSSNIPKEPIPIIGSQKIALKKDNVSKKRNDIQWEALSNHFNLIEMLK